MPNTSAPTSDTKGRSTPTHNDSQVEENVERKPNTGLLVQRAMDDPDALTPKDVQHLQRTIGNRAATRLLQPHLQAKLTVQAKLNLGPADDAYEQEADQVAEQVVRSIGHAPRPVQREMEEEEIQAKPLAQQISSLQRSSTTANLNAKQAAARPLPTRHFVAQSTRPEVTPLQRSAQHGPEGGEVDPGVTQSIQQARGGGRPLDEGVRGKMEQGFGADFSGVRIHTGSQADNLNRSLNARAFTVGRDVFFGQGEYNPGSSGGQKLIAHELTHTVQQGAAGVRRTFVQRHPSHAEEEEVQTQRIQRHPSHAEEEEVQAQRIQRHPGHGHEEEVRLTRHVQRFVQRHPSHAEEEEVQAQRIQRQVAQPMADSTPNISTTKQTANLIQPLRILVDEKKPGGGTKKAVKEFSPQEALKKMTAKPHQFENTKALKDAIQSLHDANKMYRDWDALATELKSMRVGGKNVEKRMALEAKFGINIGGEDKATSFGEKMLAKLDGILSNLPESHVAALGGITRQNESGVSFYDPNTNILTITYNIPAWLYTSAKKNTNAIVAKARTEMEKVALPVMLESTKYDKGKDASLGLNTDERSVISYADSDAFASMGIAEWSVLHEIGHGIDNKTKWTETMGSKSEFGGWHTHGEFDDATAIAEVSTAYLGEEGLTLEMLAGVQIGNAITGKDFFLSGVAGTDAAGKHTRADVLSKKFPEDQRAAMKAKLTRVYDKLILTQAAPWQFGDGLASKITVNGRIYQRDHYDSWVSYEAAARNNVLSPYQFASPGEWFAEAYAAYYGSNGASRALLNDATVAAFEKWLGQASSLVKDEEERRSGDLEQVVDGKPVLRAFTLEDLAEDEAEDQGGMDQGVQVQPQPEPELEPEPELVVGGYQEKSPLQSAMENTDDSLFD